MQLLDRLFCLARRGVLCLGLFFLFVAVGACSSGSSGPADSGTSNDLVVPKPDTVADLDSVGDTMGDDAPGPSDLVDGSVEDGESDADQDADPDLVSGYLRFVHLMNGPGKVEIYLPVGIAALGTVNFGQSTTGGDFAPFPPGTLDWHIHQGETLLFIHSTVTVPDEYMTMLFIGNSDLQPPLAPRGLNIVADAHPAPTGKHRLLVCHVGPQMGPVDLFADPNSGALTKGLEYTKFTVLTVDSGTFKLYADSGLLDGKVDTLWTLQLEDAGWSFVYLTEDDKGLIGPALHHVRAKPITTHDPTADISEPDASNGDLSQTDAEPDTTPDLDVADNQD